MFFRELAPEFNKSRSLIPDTKSFFMWIKALVIYKMSIAEFFWRVNVCLETVFRPQGTKTQDTNKIYSMNTVCSPYVYVEFNQTGTESIRGKAVNRR